MTNSCEGGVLEEYTGETTTAQDALPSSALGGEAEAMGPLALNSLLKKPSWLFQ